MRVGPVPVLRGLGTAYVTVFRNTPLLVVFIRVHRGADARARIVGTPFVVKGASR